MEERKELASQSGYHKTLLLTWRCMSGKVFSLVMGNEPAPKLSAII